MWNPIYLIFILSLFLLGLLIVYAFKRLGQGWSFKILFKDFNRKMWMTVCLGALFFGFYILIICLSAYFIGPWGTDLLFIVNQHPTEFIYGGLFLFAFLSLSIYLARMWIKYLYLTRGKDS